MGNVGHVIGNVGRSATSSTPDGNDRDSRPPSPMYARLRRIALPNGGLASASEGSCTFPSVTIDPPTRARVTLPAWIWGGNPKRLLEECEMISRPDREGRFLVQTDESYRRQR